TQTVEVEMGIDPTSAGTIIDPCNWSTDNIIRLQLINPEADLKDLTDDDYLIFDVRESSAQKDFWYVLLETSTGIDQSDSYPMLKWNPEELVCSCSDNNEYVYQLRRGLGGSGKLLISNMTQTDLYQTLPQDGKTTLYFTIIRKEKETVSEIQNPGGHILPWSGVFPGAFGWPSFPATGGFPGNLPFQTTTGYPPGIGRGVFPWTLPGYAPIEYLYPGWRTAYDFPFSFTGAGLFPTGENNLSGLYRTGFSGMDIPLMYWYCPNP
ncbi:MAG: hypothetical protein ACMUIU_17990, partial [bacterium]